MVVHLVCYPLGQESLQGSILGPLLFLVFVNDIPSIISFSELYLFADDSKLQSCSSSSSDLQEDIDSLVAWSNDNSLFLNSHKCAAIRFSLSGSVCPSYTVDDTVTPTPESHRELGVMVRGDLSWTDHYSYICSKAYSVLYMIRRSFSTVDVVVKRRLYVSMVRSKLSYCSQLWRPNLKKDILALERVQRRATKYILEDYSSSYKDRLVSLSLLPLMYWLELNDVMYLVNALKNPSDNVSVFQYVSFCKSSTCSSTQHNLQHNFNRTSKSRHFYFNRIVRIWNKLPFIDLSYSIPHIKQQHLRYLWDHFLLHFDSTNTCTFHFHCPCNSCIAT